jgi:hypothetical protein
MASNVPASLKESVENSKCEYRRLGKSGLRISVPILGCMSFGDPKSLPWSLPEEQVSESGGLSFFLNSLIY